MRLPNTPVPNPLTRNERELARSTLFKIARIFDGTEFDRTVDLSREEQARTVRRVVDDTRRAASALGADMVGFDEAACARTELDAYAEGIEGERLETLRALRTIAARLNDACERAIPERLAALEQVRAHQRMEWGFSIQAVLGQGEPFAVPPFAYTVGLEALGHPELVIVGLNHQQAGAVLAPLAQRIVVGEVIEPGPISNALEAGLTLRAVECPSVLRQALRAAYVAGEAPRALQIQWPDASGRLPGDLGVDAAMERAQVFPPDAA